MNHETNNYVTNNYGSAAIVNGGRSNTVHYSPDDAQLRVAVKQLTDSLAELRRHLTPEQDRAVEESLPALIPDRAVLRERGGVLENITRIATAVGAVGQPVEAAVAYLRGLLGAG
ncbi:hypothetical protein QWJ26_00235 [Streptomyces sp. CSDS2]|uniref:hypothetical protein n=1 Tax=Streptomyces sp. CSDS2 TaxID=3055051 RepID=UPI0025B1FA7E|nr:hypothetical protein [Streptomyces sp. CSDS2]MDN3258263.1 hypothetical protein [Streptomyces sp. CSDS2]